MKPVSFPSRLKDNRGSVALVLFFLGIAGAVMATAYFLQSYAVAVSGDAFDSYRSQYVEKNGLAALVKESVLALRETVPVNSSNSIAQEIVNRMQSMTFASGVTVTLSSVDAVPGHSFFPSATPPLATTQSVFPGLAGKGNLTAAFINMGPVADMGAFNYVFTRTVTGSAVQTIKYTVSTEIYSVPVTNCDLIAYGLPASASTPASAPTMAAGFFGSGVSRLVITSNDPNNDSTAYPDLFAPSSPEVLPAQYRNGVSFAWNAFEYIWSDAYQNALLASAGASNTYDFTALNNPVIPGITFSNGTLTIDVGSITATSIAVVDSLGTGNIVVNGSGSSGSAFVLYLKNTGPTATNVRFSTNNSRPYLLYSRRCSLNFSGGPQLQQAMILDRDSGAFGTASLFGHFSFYALASPFPAFNLSLYDSGTVKSALASIAPRVLIVSAQAIR